MVSGLALNDHCVGVDDPRLWPTDVHYHDSQSVRPHTKTHIGRSAILDG